jgi:hypothetical protein
VVLVLGVSGAALTGTALLWPVVLGPALATAAAAYAALLAIDEPAVDARAAGVAAALVVTGELVGWSRELATTSRDEAGGAWRRPAWIATVGVGTLFLVWALLAVVDLARVEGLAVEALGALAALGAVVLVWRAAQGSVTEGD